MACKRSSECSANWKQNPPALYYYYYIALHIGEIYQFFVWWIEYILVNPPNRKQETHTSELSVDAVSFGLSVQYRVWHKMPVGIVFHDWQEKMNPHLQQ